MEANQILIANLPIGAGKEVSWMLPKDCKSFTLQSRSNSILRISIIQGNAKESQNPYFTLKANNSMDESHFNINYAKDLVLFLASDVDTIAEIFYTVSSENIEPELASLERR